MDVTLFLWHLCDIIANSGSNPRTPIVKGGSNFIRCFFGSRIWTSQGPNNIASIVIMSPYWQGHGLPRHHNETKPNDNVTHEYVFHTVSCKMEEENSPHHGQIEGTKHYCWEVWSVFFKVEFHIEESDTITSQDIQQKLRARSFQG